MTRVYGVHRKLVTGVEAFYKMQVHVLKVNELWVTTPGYTGKHDRMCVSPCLLNVSMDEVMPKLNPRINNKQVKVRARNGHGLKV